MAAVTVTFDGQRMHDMGDTDGTTGISASGGGQSPGSEPDFFYQGAAAISKKVGTTKNGVQVDTSAFGTPRSVDLTAADRHTWFVKGQATNFKALVAFHIGPIDVQAGSSSADYWTFAIANKDPEFYPTTGGFLIQAWDPNNSEYRNNTTGSPSATAVDHFVFECDFTASSRAENVILDAVDVGIGLTLVGGDGADADANWDSFVDADENTANNRWGCFSTKEGIMYVLGMHWIGRNAAGTTTATVFQDDENRTLVFPNSFTSAGAAGISIDLGNATTDVDWIGSALLGRGVNARILFDTENDVDGANDEITLQDIIDAFKPGDPVIARSLGGTETVGLTNGNTYYVGKDTTATPTGITLHNTLNAAHDESGFPGSTVPVNLTASTAGNGELWRIDKKIDTRPDLTVTGTSGTFDMVGGTLTDLSVITLTSACTLDGVLLLGCRTLTQAGSVIDGCTVKDHVTVEAEYFIDSNDLADIDNNSFDNTGNRGHAIRGTQTGSVNLDGNTFTGYFSVTDQTKHQFDNTNDVDGTGNDITLPTGHGYVDGDPVVYSKMLTANTAITGLTDQTTYYLSVTGDVVQLHLNEGDALNGNAPIGLTAGTGNETHALWPANAAFFNDSGGATTLNIGNQGDVPSVRNALNTTTTVLNTVTLTVQVDDEDGNPVSGARVRIENASTGAQISQGTTNASGTYTDATYNYAADLDVLTKVRLKGFKNFRTGGTITAAGLTVGVRFATDDIVDLP